MPTKLTRLICKPDTSGLIHFGRRCPVATTRTPALPGRLPGIILPGKVNYRGGCRLRGSRTPRQRRHVDGRAITQILWGLLAASDQSSTPRDSLSVTSVPHRAITGQFFY